MENIDTDTYGAEVDSSQHSVEVITIEVGGQIKPLSPYDAIMRNIRERTARDMGRC
jgi:hypothetical protein